jgi:hypothetical protein
MITPAGKECRFYYQDFHRGHATQECRLVLNNAKSKEWKPGDCQTCPVPEILLANSSPDLVLEGTIKESFMGMKRRMEVTAFCSKHLIDVPEPPVGCKQCALEKPGLQELFGS